MKIKEIETITKSEQKKAIRYFEKKHPGSEVIVSGWATHRRGESDIETGFQTVSVELWSEEERESYTVYLSVCLWDRRRSFVMDDAENWYREPAEEATANTVNNNEEENIMKTNNTDKKSINGNNQEASAEMKVEEILEKVEQTKTRSAWERGVKEYALEMIDSLGYGVRHGYIESDELENRRLLEKAMLNGASDWRQYSEGGCALCYDGQIADRLCAPWELRKTDNGRKNPNHRESWIDVQSRALYQAAQMILRVAF